MERGTVKPRQILVLLAVCCLAACTATPPKSDQPMVVITGKAPNPKREDWPKAQAALQALIEDKEFSGLSSQTYGSWRMTPRMRQFEARWRAMLVRADVQEAIQKVGRVESYHLEAQLQ